MGIITGLERLFAYAEIDRIELFLAIYLHPLISNRVNTPALDIP